MKYCLLVLFLFLTVSGAGQEAGLRVAGTLSLNALGLMNAQRNWNYSAGGWYEQPVGKRLSVSAGLNYLQYGKVPSKAINNLGAVYQTLHLAEVPVLLTFRLRNAPTAGWNSRVLAGYSLGKVMAAREYLYGSNDSYYEYSRSGAGFAPYHFINVGLELRRRWSGGFTAAIGLMGRFGSRSQQGEGEYNAHDLSLALSTGYDFAAKRAKTE